MIEIKNKMDCCGCYACCNICPKNAIEMIEDDNGFKYPKVDKEKCINCNLCEKVCPILSQTKVENKIKVAYACINKNVKERLNSSSGGIFSLLAKNILNKNGIVFGAMFNNEWDVVHGYIETYEDIDKLQGSKYVQSTIGNSYKKVKEFLEKDRYVLFTGTPCQIEGLKNFLGKEYEKLITQDVICHGVPSPKAWKKYKEYRIKKDKENPKKISFRNKDNGWSNFNMKFSYEKSNYKKNQQTDLFMQAFLRNTILRDSCYNCHFKKKDRVSDITLADFWGIDRILPDFYDNNGVSLVIVNSEKGKILFEKIKNDIKCREVDLLQAIKYNPSMVKSVKADPKREEFFENIDNYDFNKLVNKFTSKPVFIKRVLSRVKKYYKK